MGIRVRNHMITSPRLPGMANRTRIACHWPILPTGRDYSGYHWPRLLRLAPCQSPSRAWPHGGTGIVPVTSRLTGTGTQAGSLMTRTRVTPDRRQWNWLRVQRYSSKSVVRVQVSPDEGVGQRQREPSNIGANRQYYVCIVQVTISNSSYNIELAPP